MKKICLLLVDGFEALEASAFTDIMGWNEFEGDHTTKLITVGTKEKIKCTWNFTVEPEMLLKDVDVDDFDALAIPGGFEEAGFYRDGFSEEVSTFIKQFDRLGKIIASICVGSLIVANSGVLKGRKATTYHLSNGNRQKQLAAFGVEVILNQPIVVDQNIISSYNPATSFDVAFKLLELLTSKENCINVKKLMGF